MKYIKVKLSDAELRKLRERADENSRFVCVQAGIDIARTNKEYVYLGTRTMPTENEALKERYKENQQKGVKP